MKINRNFIIIFISVSLFITGISLFTWQIKQSPKLLPEIAWIDPGWGGPSPTPPPPPPPPPPPGEPPPPSEPPPPPPTDCDPGDLRCSGSIAQYCNSQGKWRNDQTCAYGCQNGDCLPPPPPGCPEGQSQCTGGKTYKTCTNGNWVSGLCTNDEICESSTGDCQAPPVQPPTPTECTSGQSQCSGPTSQKTCFNGQWVIEQCAGDQTCQGNSCQATSVKPPPPPAPTPVIPPKPVEGTLTAQCSAQDLTQALQQTQIQQQSFFQKIWFYLKNFFIKLFKKPLEIFEQNQCPVGTTYGSPGTPAAPPPEQQPPAVDWQKGSADDPCSRHINIPHNYENCLQAVTLAPNAVIGCQDDPAQVCGINWEVAYWSGAAIDDKNPKSPNGQIDERIAWQNDANKRYQDYYIKNSSDPCAAYKGNKSECQAYALNALQYGFAIFEGATIENGQITALLPQANIEYNGDQINIGDLMKQTYYDPINANQIAQKAGVMEKILASHNYDTYFVYQAIQNAGTDFLNQLCPILDQCQADKLDDDLVLQFIAQYSDLRLPITPVATTTPQETPTQTETPPKEETITASKNSQEQYVFSFDFGNNIPVSPCPNDKSLACIGAQVIQGVTWNDIVNRQPVKLNSFLQAYLVKPSPARDSQGNLLYYQYFYNGTFYKVTDNQGKAYLCLSDTNCLDMQTSFSDIAGESLDVLFFEANSKILEKNQILTQAITGSIVKSQYEGIPVNLPVNEQVVKVSYGDLHFFIKNGNVYSSFLGATADNQPLNSFVATLPEAWVDPDYLTKNGLSLNTINNLIQAQTNNLKLGSKVKTEANFTTQNFLGNTIQLPALPKLVVETKDPNSDQAYKVDLVPINPYTYSQGFQATTQHRGYDLLLDTFSSQDFGSISDLKKTGLTLPLTIGLTQNAQKYTARMDDILDNSQKNVEQSQEGVVNCAYDDQSQKRTCTNNLTNQEVYAYTYNYIQQDGVKVEYHLIKDNDKFYLESVLGKTEINPSYLVYDQDNPDLTQAILESAHLTILASHQPEPETQAQTQTTTSQLSNQFSANQIIKIQPTITSTDQLISYNQALEEAKNQNRPEDLTNANLQTLLSGQKIPVDPSLKKTNPDVVCEPPGSTNCFLPGLKDYIYNLSPQLAKEITFSTGILGFGQSYKGAQIKVGQNNRIIDPDNTKEYLQVFQTYAKKGLMFCNNIIIYKSSGNISASCSSLGKSYQKNLTLSDLQTFAQENIPRYKQQKMFEDTLAVINQRFGTDISIWQDPTTWDPKVRQLVMLTYASALENDSNKREIEDFIANAAPMAGYLAVGVATGGQSIAVQIAADMAADIILVDAQSQAMSADEKRNYQNFVYALDSECGYTCSNPMAWIPNQRPFYNQVTKQTAYGDLQDNSFYEREVKFDSLLGKAGDLALTTDQYINNLSYAAALSLMVPDSNSKLSWSISTPAPTTNNGFLGFLAEATAWLGDAVNLNYPDFNWYALSPEEKTALIKKYPELKPENFAIANLSWDQLSDEQKNNFTQNLNDRYQEYLETNFPLLVLSEEPNLEANSYSRNDYYDFHPQPLTIDQAGAMFTLTQDLGNYYAQKYSQSLLPQALAQAGNDYQTTYYANTGTSLALAPVANTLGNIGGELISGYFRTGARLELIEASIAKVARTVDNIPLTPGLKLVEKLPDELSVVARKTQVGSVVSSGLEKIPGLNKVAGKLPLLEREIMPKSALVDIGAKIIRNGQEIIIDTNNIGTIVLQSGDTFVGKNGVKLTIGDTVAYVDNQVAKKALEINQGLNTWQKATLIRNTDLTAEVTAKARNKFRNIADDALNQPRVVVSNIPDNTVAVPTSTRVNPTVNEIAQTRKNLSAPLVDQSTVQQAVNLPQLTDDQAQLIILARQIANTSTSDPQYQTLTTELKEQLIKLGQQNNPELKQALDEAIGAAKDFRLANETTNPNQQLIANAFGKLNQASQNLDTALKQALAPPPAAPVQTARQALGGFGQTMSNIGQNIADIYHNAINYLDNITRQQKPAKTKVISLLNTDGKEIFIPIKNGRLTTSSSIVINDLEQTKGGVSLIYSSIGDLRKGIKYSLNNIKKDVGDLVNIVAKKTGPDNLTLNRGTHIIIQVKDINGQMQTIVHETGLDVTKIKAPKLRTKTLTLPTQPPPARTTTALAPPPAVPVQSVKQGLGGLGQAMSSNAKKIWTNTIGAINTDNLPLIGKSWQEARRTAKAKQKAFYEEIAKLNRQMVSNLKIEQGVEFIKNGLKDGSIKPKKAAEAIRNLENRQIEWLEKHGFIYNEATRTYSLNGRRVYVHSTSHLVELPTPPAPLIPDAGVANMTARYAKRVNKNATGTIVTGKKGPKATIFLQGKKAVKGVDNIITDTMALSPEQIQTYGRLHVVANGVDPNQGYLASNEFIKSFYILYYDPNFFPMLTGAKRLKSAIEKANLITYNNTGKIEANLTLTAVVEKNGQLFAVSIGETPIGLYKANGSLEVISPNKTIVQLGSNPNLANHQINVVAKNLSAGDRIVLASDGLKASFPADITKNFDKIIDEIPDSQKAAEKLVKTADKNQKLPFFKRIFTKPEDNGDLTALVIDIEKGTTPPAPQTVITTYSIEAKPPSFGQRLKRWLSPDSINCPEVNLIEGYEAFDKPILTFWDKVKIVFKNIINWITGKPRPAEIFSQAICNTPALNITPKGTTTSPDMPPLQRSFKLGSGNVDAHVPEAAPEHAQIFKRQGRYYIADLESGKGTFVNDLLVTAPQVLKNGDVIRFGSQTKQRIIFHEYPSGATAIDIYRNGKFDSKFSLSNILEDVDIPTSTAPKPPVPLLKKPIKAVQNAWQKIKQAFETTPGCISEIGLLEGYEAFDKPILTFWDKVKIVFKNIINWITGKPRPAEIFSANLCPLSPAYKEAKEFIGNIFSDLNAELRNKGKKQVAQIGLTPDSSLNLVKQIANIIEKNETLPPTLSQLIQDAVEKSKRTGHAIAIPREFFDELENNYPFHSKVLGYLTESVGVVKNFNYEQRLKHEGILGKLVSAYENPPSAKFISVPDNATGRQIYLAIKKATENNQYISPAILNFNPDDIETLYLAFSPNFRASFGSGAQVKQKLENILAEVSSLAKKDGTTLEQIIDQANLNHAHIQIKRIILNPKKTKQAVQALSNSNLIEFENITGINPKQYARLVNHSNGPLTQLQVRADLFAVAQLDNIVLPDNQTKTFLSIVWPKLPNTPLPEFLTNSQTLRSVLAKAGFENIPDNIDNYLTGLRNSRLEFALQLIIGEEPSLAKKSASQIKEALIQEYPHFKKEITSLGITDNEVSKLAKKVGQDIENAKNIGRQIRKNTENTTFNQQKKKAITLGKIRFQEKANPEQVARLKIVLARFYDGVLAGEQEPAGLFNYLRENGFDHPKLQNLLVVEESNGIKIYPDLRQLNQDLAVQQGLGRPKQIGSNVNDCFYGAGQFFLEGYEAFDKPILTFWDKVKIVFKNIINWITGKPRPAEIFSVGICPPDFKQKLLEPAIRNLTETLTSKSRVTSVDFRPENMKALAQAIIKELDSGQALPATLIELLQKAKTQKRIYLPPKIISQLETDPELQRLFAEKFAAIIAASKNELTPADVIAPKPGSILDRWFRQYGQITDSITKLPAEETNKITQEEFLKRFTQRATSYTVLDKPLPNKSDLVDLMKKVGLNENPNDEFLENYLNGLKLARVQKALDLEIGSTPNLAQRSAQDIIDHLQTNYPALASDINSINPEKLKNYADKLIRELKAQVKAQRKKPFNFFGQITNPCSGSINFLEGYEAFDKPILTFWDKVLIVFKNIINWITGKPRPAEIFSVEVCGNNPIKNLPDFNADQKVPLRQYEYELPKSSRAITVKTDPQNPLDVSATDLIFYKNSQGEFVPYMAFQFDYPFQYTMSDIKSGYFPDPQHELYILRSPTAEIPVEHYIKLSSMVPIDIESGLKRKLVQVPITDINPEKLGLPNPNSSTHIVTVNKNTFTATAFTPENFIPLEEEENISQLLYLLKNIHLPTRLGKGGEILTDQEWQFLGSYLAKIGKEQEIQKAQQLLTQLTRIRKEVEKNLTALLENKTDNMTPIISKYMHGVRLSQEEEKIIDKFIQLNPEKESQFKNILKNFELIRNYELEIGNLADSWSREFKKHGGFISLEDLRYLLPKKEFQSFNPNQYKYIVVLERKEGLGFGIYIVPKGNAKPTLYLNAGSIYRPAREELFSQDDTLFRAYQQAIKTETAIQEAEKPLRENQQPLVKKLFAPQENSCPDQFFLEGYEAFDKPILTFWDKVKIVFKNIINWITGKPRPAEIFSVGVCGKSISLPTTTTNASTTPSSPTKKANFFTRAKNTVTGLFSRESKTFSIKSTTPVPSDLLPQVKSGGLLAPRQYRITNPHETYTLAIEHNGRYIHLKPGQTKRLALREGDRIYFLKKDLFIKAKFKVKSAEENTFMLQKDLLSAAGDDFVSSADNYKYDNAKAVAYFQETLDTAKEEGEFIELEPYHQLAQKYLENPSSMPPTVTELLRLHNYDFNPENINSITEFLAAQDYLRKKHGHLITIANQQIQEDYLKASNLAYRAAGLTPPETRALSKHPLTKEMVGFYAPSAHKSAGFYHQGMIALNANLYKTYSAIKLNNFSPKKQIIGLIQHEYEHLLASKPLRTQLKHPGFPSRDVRKIEEGLAEEFRRLINPSHVSIYKKERELIYTKLMRQLSGLSEPEYLKLLKQATKPGSSDEAVQSLIQNQLEARLLILEAMEGDLDPLLIRLGGVRKIKVEIPEWETKTFSTITEVKDYLTKNQTRITKAPYVVINDSKIYLDNIDNIEQIFTEIYSGALGQKQKLGYLKLASIYGSGFRPQLKRAIEAVENGKLETLTDDYIKSVIQEPSISPLRYYAEKIATRPIETIKNAGRRIFGDEVNPCFDSSFIGMLEGYEAFDKPVLTFWDRILIVVKNIWNWLTGKPRPAEIFTASPCLTTEAGISQKLGFFGGLAGGLGLFGFREGLPPAAPPAVPPKEGPPLEEIDTDNMQLKTPIDNSHLMMIARGQLDELNATFPFLQSETGIPANASPEDWQRMIAGDLFPYGSVIKPCGSSAPAFCESFDVGIVHDLSSQSNLVFYLDDLPVDRNNLDELRNISVTYTFFDNGMGKEKTWDFGLQFLNDKPESEGYNKIAAFANGFKAGDITAGGTITIAYKGQTVQFQVPETLMYKPVNEPEQSVTYISKGSHTAFFHLSIGQALLKSRQETKPTVTSEIPPETVTTEAEVPEMIPPTATLTPPAPEQAQSFLQKFRSFYQALLERLLGVRKQQQQDLENRMEQIRQEMPPPVTETPVAPQTEVTPETQTTPESIVTTVPGEKTFGDKTLIPADNLDPSGIDYDSRGWNDQAQTGLNQPYYKDEWDVADNGIVGYFDNQGVAKTCDCLIGDNGRLYYQNNQPNDFVDPNCGYVILPPGSGTDQVEAYRDRLCQ